MKQRKMRLNWTCSDFVKHEHRWKLAAWLCGRAQAVRAALNTEVRRDG